MYISVEVSEHCLALALNKDTDDSRPEGFEPALELELEAHPTRVQPPQEDDGADPFEFEIPGSILPPPLHSARSDGLDRSARGESTVVHELNLDFEVPSAPSTASVVPTPLPAPASIASPSAPAVPDLEVPRARASRPNAPGSLARAAPGSARAAPDKPVTSSEQALVLEVDYGSAPRASGAPHKVSSSMRPTPLGARPSAAPPAVALRSSVPPANNLVDFSSGLDELDMAGSLRAAQLDVAIALPKRDEDGPWPRGRTPFDDELEIGADSVRRVGFGLAPDGIWGTPAYALRVGRRRPRLTTELSEATSQLQRREHLRDERLAVLAEFKRPELMRQERFAELYAQVDACTADLQDKTREIEALDRRGSNQLQHGENQLSILKAKSVQLEAAQALVRERVEAQQTHLARLTAALKRLHIEERNLTQRFENDGIAEADHRHGLAEIAHKTDAIQREIEQGNLEAEALKRELQAADNQVRIALAEQQHQEGAMEAQLIALEGEGAERTRSLSELKATRTRLLADIARAVLELRGQVPVEAADRNELLTIDAQVRDAALARRKLRLALDTLDRSALRSGLGLWIALGVMLVLGLVHWITSHGE